MKLLFVIASVVTCSLAYTQANMSATTRHDLAQIRQQWKKGGATNADCLTRNFPIYKMDGSYCISMIAKVESSFSPVLLEPFKIVLGSRIGNIISLKVPLNQLDQIEAVPGIALLEIAERVQPNLDKALKDARVDSVHAGFGLPQPYTGKNVYIGVTDWGFDYTHPMYYDTSLTYTRIAAAWDQYKQSGPAPAGYSYGTEYTTPGELLAAGSDTANIYSYAFHGGHVAGIAGGSGAGTPYRGVAFDAEFLFATFLVDAASVLDAYQWMYEKAVSANKRLVINQSWGLYYMGTLDGTSLLSQAIDNYSDLGVVFATSGGNNGDVNLHIKKEFDNDTLRSRVNFYSYSANPSMWGQSLTLWGEPSHDFSVSVKILNTAGSLQAQTPFYSTASTSDYIDSMLVVGQDTVFFNVSAEQANPFNQRPHIRFRVKNTNTSLRTVMEVAAAEGTVHAWNLTELSNGVGNWGMPFTSLGAGYTAGNSAYSIGEPACTESSIAVAAHSSEYYNGSGNLVGGGLASFSSCGPTLDERQKPEISAPGVSVASSVSSFTDASFSTAATVSFNGHDYKFTRISGTSMSSPMVTGAIALILEANPYLMPSQIKDILIETAREDTDTGILPEEGDPRWGYGKLNVYKAIELALNTAALSAGKQTIFRMYPNPVSSLLYFEGDFHGNELFELFTAEGKRILSGTVSASGTDLSSLNAGLYLVLIHTASGTETHRLIKR